MNYEEVNYKSVDDALRNIKNMDDEGLYSISYSHMNVTAEGRKGIKREVSSFLKLNDSESELSIRRLK